MLRNPSGDGGVDFTVVLNEVLSLNAQEYIGCSHGELTL